MIHPFERFRPLLKIEDDKARQEAILALWDSLSEEEKQQVAESVGAMVGTIVEMWQPVLDTLGKIGDEWLRAIQAWVDDNPEIRLYLNRMALEEYERSL